MSTKQILSAKNTLRADPDTRCVLSSYEEPPIGRSLAETIATLRAVLKLRAAAFRVAFMDTKAMAPATIPSALEKSRKISLV